jgi:hypothetical protein
LFSTIQDYYIQNKKQSIHENKESVDHVKIIRDSNVTLRKMLPRNSSTTTNDDDAATTITT